MKVTSCEGTCVGFGACCRGQHDTGWCRAQTPAGPVRFLPEQRAAKVLLQLACGHLSPVVAALPDVPVRFCPTCRKPRLVIDRVDATQPVGDQT